MRVFRGALAVLLAVALGAAACTGTDVSECGAPGSGPITFATVKNLSAGQRAELKQRWQAENPSEPLEIVVLPSTSDQQRAQLAATLRVGKRGGAARRDGYDVVGLDVVFLPEFAREGLLEPLDESRYSGSGFLGGPWEMAHYARQLYAVPFTTNVGLLYYWPDRLVELGVLRDTDEQWTPQDWQSVLKVAQDSRLRGPGGAVGYTAQLAPYEGLTANALELIYGEQGDLPRRGHPVPPEKLAGASRGIGFLIDGVRNDWIDSSALGFDEQSSLNAFADRRALILRHWPDAWATLTADGDSPAPGVTRLPPGSAVLGGESLAVARCSPYKATAGKFLSFLTAPEQQVWAFRTGLYLPTVARLYTDGSLSADGGPSPEFVSLLGASVTGAKPRPADPAWNTTSRNVQAVVHNALERAAATPVDANEVVNELVAVP